MDKDYDELMKLADEADEREAPEWVGRELRKQAGE